MAFSQYVEGAAIDKADELYSAVRGENGIEYVLGIVGKMRQKISSGAAKALRARIDADEKVVKDVVALKAKITNSPEDAKLHEQLALAYVAIGDWEHALFAFRDCKGEEVSKVAAWELSDERSGDYDAAKVAKFWWDFAVKRFAEKQAEGQTAKMVKAHAANWYEKAVALNLLTGSDARLASKRIDQCKAFAAQTPVQEPKEKEGLYMIVDLAKTGKSAISYLDDVPKKGWIDEYRTKKIVLRKIEPGSFEYLKGKSFKITKPFYIGVFEVTRMQYEMLMKKEKTSQQHNKADMMHPVENVSWYDIRGAKKGLGWPKNSLVDDDSYLGRLRKKVRLDFDLPTEVQWEYACRAGTTGDFNVDGVNMDKLGKYKDNNKGQGGKHVKVGSFMPNAWGLYDMHGNVWEWCADRGKDEWSYEPFGWTDNDKESKGGETDPKGSEAGESSFLRGGSWNASDGACGSSVRLRRLSKTRSDAIGFRLACSAGTAK